MGKKQGDIAVRSEPAATGAVAGPEWEPFRALRRQMDRWMADFDGPDFRFGLPRKMMMPQLWPEPGITVPPVDLVERDDGYELQVELPGLTEKQVEVKLSDGVMTIKGEKSAERVEDQADFHLRERSYGAFQRSFRVPSGVEGDKIQASFENGVLKVSLPKSAATQQTARKIEVKPA
ncbi:Hsp20 family protein [bacterium]|nr:Hsp20 family protein [bacterium]